MIGTFEYTRNTRDGTDAVCRDRGRTVAKARPAGRVRARTGSRCAFRIVVVNMY